MAGFLNGVGSFQNRLFANSENLIQIKNTVRLHQRKPIPQSGIANPAIVFCQRSPFKTTYGKRISRIEVSTFLIGVEIFI
ncbi:hypothetical protein LEP1GSC047_2273 [Leptospira inadai serovar Lyme str. 10]|uniref:Uncharacterized protein n=2 Tax=Leptospira inadai serovar Lyme TaxID=293084 RepID=V6HEX6_9LEPT|nr:hypothetical protein LEP1GSC047_2273 [Leptospira inadai serovar Lyme str. 10]PNV72250.1 hypothetical protein BES34_019865 [Leptospira inadai serovar Lyme]